MRHLLPLLSLALSAAIAALPGGAQAAGRVEVHWLQPEQFSDIGRSAADRERHLADLAESLQQLGAALPDGQTLTLEVSDVDLAGELLPGRLHDIRVLRDRADWPRLQLHYTLRAGTSVLKSGQADLADMNYFFGPRPQGSLAYEKRMIDRWFRSEFSAR